MGHTRRQCVQKQHENANAVTFQFLKINENSLKLHCQTQKDTTNICGQNQVPDSNVQTQDHKLYHKISDDRNEDRLWLYLHLYGKP